MIHGTLILTLPSFEYTIVISLLPQVHLSFTISADSENIPTALITPAPQCGHL
jgi:hypothetical protein